MDEFAEWWTSASQNPKFKSQKLSAEHEETEAEEQKKREEQKLRQRLSTLRLGIFPADRLEVAYAHMVGWM